MSRLPLSADLEHRSSLPELSAAGRGLDERLLVDLVAEEERLAHLAASDRLRSTEAHLLAAIASEIDLRWSVFLGDVVRVG